MINGVYKQTYRGAHIVIMDNIWHLLINVFFHHKTELCNIASGKHTQNDGTSQFY